MEEREREREREGVKISNKSVTRVASRVGRRKRRRGTSDIRDGREGEAGREGGRGRHAESWFASDDKTIVRTRVVWALSSRVRGEAAARITLLKMVFAPLRETH